MPEDKAEQLLAFTKRLETLLLKKGKTLSPTALARDFNLRWRGMPVTVNATRKWLMGQSMPTMDKLSVLANLLNTSEDWLRWGDMAAGKKNNFGYSPISEAVIKDLEINEKSFAQDFKLLNANNKQVIGAVMEVLLHQQQLATQNSKRES
jgi:transcriptional regulator with XRE-family HTH domain